MAEPLARHDQALLLLGVLTTGALGLVEANLLGGALGLATGAYALAVPAARRRSERGALVLAYLYALAFYEAVALIVPALGRQPVDAALLAIDEALFGATPALWSQGLPDALVDVFSLAYAAYLPYLHGVLLIELWRSRARARALGARLFMAFAIGFAGYLLVPAVGPYQASPELFQAPLGGGWLTRTVVAGMEAGSPGFDVFPSLHVLITAVVWTHDWRHARARALAMAPVVVLLLMATIVLRFHYAIDLLAAGVVFALVEVLAEKSNPPGLRMHQV